MKWTENINSQSHYPEALFQKIKSSPYSGVPNAILFYIGWTINAYSAIEGAPVKGMAIALLLVSFHLFVLSTKSRLDLLLCCFSVFIGLVADTIFMHTILSYKALSPWIPATAPLWILADYLLFATLINHCLSFLEKRVISQYILGGLGGALSYYIGVQIGAISFTVPLAWGLSVIGICWALLVPLYFWMNRQLDALLKRSPFLLKVLDWLVWYFPVYAVQFISAWVTVGSVGTWYKTLTKAPWGPPNWLFGPVWTIIYILMAVGIWLIAKGGSSDTAKKRCTFVFFLQLGFNGLWSYLFFGLQRPDLALIDLTILCIIVFYQISLYWRVLPTAAILQLPYLLWALYALSLNAAIYWLN